MWTPTTYTTPTGKKYRDDRLHDDRYRKEVMEREFQIRGQIIQRGVDAEELAYRAAVPGDLSRAGTVDGAGGYSGQPVSGHSSEHNLILEQSKTLENMSSALYALAKQLEKPIQGLFTIRWEVEQAGRKNERRRLRLPRIHLPELPTVTLKGAVLTLMALVVSGILLYALAALWSVVKPLLQPLP